MAITMTATDFKNSVLTVLNRVSAGEEVEVTKRGRPVARVIPFRNRPQLLGMCVGIAATVGDEPELYSTGETWNAS